ncbi:helicase C-terminal domain-containing protein [Paenibacillus xerothermodurans]|uniref:ATP-dependent DNA helicase n=1 Tax=Paenibacillus xerothermodurans TaxID=1977292 RepID=A0A2W1NR01_PAEXE|nr:helicase C-terminal domain-containing protein [Paenibacillus xerothermodurans]PZE20166.1 ATP-dependent DNA helicase [Paenibacillus xerothermodurans]
MPDTIHVAVRALVEYVFRTGSIDYGFRTAASLTEGTKAHQRVQKQYAELDQKELYLSAEVAHDDLLFVIDGRCDGLLAADDGVTVDEIKSTSGDLALITAESYPVHWAQANCYAYMYAKEHGTRRMRVQLTYVQVDTGEQKQFMRETTYEELQAFVLDVVRQYSPFAKLMQRHQLARNASIAELTFPFDAFREGQRKLIGAVYKTIEAGTSLFAQAPTGVGKTISTTFPTVKAMERGLLHRLFYLTAKTITRTAAEEAFSLMQAKGLRMHVVTITAKDKVCFQAETRCTREACDYADGYYDRVNEGLLDLLSNETLMTRQVIERYARKHRLCPFEFSLDAAYAADAVICDYNYVFDPRVSLKRQLAEQKKHTVLLIDEAHNLVDRTRDMFSAELLKSQFLALQREFKGVNRDLYEAAKAVNDYFIALRKQSTVGQSVQTQLPHKLVELAEAFAASATLELASGALAHDHAMLLDTYFAALSFGRIAQLYDQRYVTLIDASKSEVRVRLFCIDPSQLLRQIGKGYRSHIYFSATLSPRDYYMDMLGADQDDYTVAIPSPFARDQLEVSILPLSTRYRDRERTKEPLVALLRELTQTRPGNYLFFFPSYEYMHSVYEAFAEEARGVRTIVQQMNMPEEERERFLAEFTADNEQAFAGFAVMGGIFSEGIDLVGDRLTGVVVVGVGLPQIGLEREIIKDHFNASGKKGYVYAYVYPGMNKVLQAGGRLIRSEHDRGLLVLVDDRYLQAQYQRLLPDEWKHYTVLQPQTPPGEGL